MSWPASFNYRTYRVDIRPGPNGIDSLPYSGRPFGPRVPRNGGTQGAFVAIIFVTGVVPPACQLSVLIDTLDGLNISNFAFMLAAFAPTDVIEIVIVWQGARLI